MLETERELDAEVAEKVLGWREIHYRENLGFQQWWGLAAGKHEFDTLPFFTDDIAAAWQVAEAWGITLSHAVSLPWHCHLLRYVDGRWLRGDAEAETAPLAICRAALTAVSQSSAASDVASPES